MHIYLKNNRAKFHSNPILNDGVLGSFEDGRPNKNKKKTDKMSSDMKSVPDLKIGGLPFRTTPYILPSYESTTYHTAVTDPIENLALYTNIVDGFIRTPGPATADRLYCTRSSHLRNENNCEDAAKTAASQRDDSATGR